MIPETLFILPLLLALSIAAFWFGLTLYGRDSFNDAFFGGVFLMLGGALGFVTVITITIKALS